jgi:hypothetical protein
LTCSVLNERGLGCGFVKESLAAAIEKEQVVNEYSRFIGLDTHKESITVAYAPAGRQAPVDYGDIPNAPEAAAKMVKKLAHGGKVRFCYEAGACGYGLYRQLGDLGQECVVVAPALIPRKPGCRVKTNRRAARSLARLDRAGELTAVWAPDESQEAIRDLVRCRKDFKEQERMVRQRLGAFLLRQGRRLEGKAWTQVLPVQAVTAVARELSGCIWANRLGGHGQEGACAIEGPAQRPGHPSRPQRADPIAEAAPGRTRPPSASRPRQPLRQFLDAGRPG